MEGEREEGRKEAREGGSEGLQEEGREGVSLREVEEEEEEEEREREIEIERERERERESNWKQQHAAVTAAACTAPRSRSAGQSCSTAFPAASSSSCLPSAPCLWACKYGALDDGRVQQRMDKCQGMISAKCLG